MKTLIAIPCMNMLPYQFVQSLLYMKKGEKPTVYFKANSLVYDSRNIISLHAIQNDYDNVMWLDSDIVFPPDTLTKLAAYDMDMVSGLYVKRAEPVAPVIYETLDEPIRNADGMLETNVSTYDNYPKNSFFPVAGCGFGCVLTSVKLLKDVWDHFGPAFTPYPWASEDLSFCHRVNQLGYQIYCDSSISCGHLGQFIYSEDLLVRGDEIDTKTTAT